MPKTLTKEDLFDRVLNEIVSSERDYLRNLLIVINVNFQFEKKKII